MARTLLAGMLAAFAALLLFGWLAQEVVAGASLRFDAAVRDAVHGWASPPVTYAMRGITMVGAPVSLIGFTIVSVFLLARKGRRRAATLFSIAMAGAEVLERVLKAVFPRVRPVPFFGMATPESSSFPSGHALVSCCFFGCAAALLAPAGRTRGQRAGIWAACAVAAGLVGLSRIYLGVHYASDVMAGYAAAVVWTWAVYVVGRRGTLGLGIPKL